MRRHLLFGALAACTSSCLLVAQSTIVIPNGYSAQAGNAANIFPFGTASTTYAGLRILFVYDSSEFTAQAIPGPILISGIKFRAAPTGNSWTGGTYTMATVSMSTAAVDYLNTSTNYPSNHGPDLTVMHNGPVVVQAGTGNGAGVPGPFHIDITFASPFAYDPNQGDLAIEFDNPSPSTNWGGGGLTALDHVGATGNPVPAVRRVYGSTAYPNANGVDQYAAICELTYTPAAGYAQKSTYGQGCNTAFASFYENHTAFDLSNTSLALNNTGSGYVVLSGTTAVAASTSTPVTMADDQVLTFPLGWALPYPGGVTTDLYVSSNGFVNFTPNTNNGCCAFNIGQLLSNGPCIAAKWRDLNPAAGGSVYFDTDPVAGTATVTFDMVPDYGSTTNVNTFQYAFDQSGLVELRFGNVAATAGGTGWSPGLGNANPGSIDLSTLPVIIVGGVDVSPLTLNADARPIIGTTVNNMIGTIPTGSVLAAVIYGFTKYDPGINLGSIGMPDCFQYCSQDAVSLIIAPGTSAQRPFSIPNDPGLVGVIVLTQAAAYDPPGGHNALGALSSNGVQFLLDLL